MDDEKWKKVNKSHQGAKPPRELAWPRVSRIFDGKAGGDSFDVHQLFYENSAPYVEDKYRVSHWFQSLSREVQNAILTEFASDKYKSEGGPFDSVATIPYHLATQWVRRTYQRDDVLAKKITKFYEIRQDGMPVTEYIRKRKKDATTAIEIYLVLCMYHTPAHVPYPSTCTCSSYRY